MAPAATANTLVFGLSFTILAFLHIQTWRVEVLANMVPELLFNLILSAICVSQARFLANIRGSKATLQVALSAAPVVLVWSWLGALVVGLAWPFPALSAFQSAPPTLLVFRAFLLLPQGFYSAVVGWLFLKAAGPLAPARYLRVKNFSFFVGCFAWFLQALNSAAHGAVRVFLPDGTREAVVLPQMYLERSLYMVSIVAFAVGLTLRYAPTVNRTLVEQVYPALLSLRERFEARRWNLANGGGIRGLVRARHYTLEAGKRLELPEDDLSKTLTTLELAAMMSDPTAENSEVTPDKARELLALQERVLHEDEKLASMIRWHAVRSPNHDSPDHDSPDYEKREETLASASFIPALSAALQLVEPARATQGSAHPDSPLWYHLAAVAAADSGISRHEGLSATKQDLPRVRVLRAYQAAKDSSRSQIAENQ